MQKEKSAKKIIIANWKMNPSSLEEVEKLFISNIKTISSIKKITVVICPPVLYLERLKALSGELSYFQV